MSMLYSAKLVERYRELRAAAPVCLLLMQVGSFMQVQDEDARAVAALTGLKLQMAGEVDAPVVVGGFPQSGLDTYVGKLVRAGHNVAIALQDAQKERHIRERALVLRWPGVERPRPLATLSSMLPDSAPTNEVLP